MEKSSKHGKNTLTIDEMLTLVGEYGIFQKIINMMFCVTMFPSAFQILIMYFCTKSPPWRCKFNSTLCLSHNQTFHSKETIRCLIPRDQWEYVTPRDYSIVTEFDLVCEKEYLTVFPTSALFFGFIFGASVLGWFADNFGRKRVHYISLAAVIILGFISSFLGNIYAFIVCRFVIGFFMHGTFPQLYVMISEIVGNKDRAWANNVTFISVAIGFCTLALKAYLLSSWKLLFRVCTMPYIFVLFFYFFVPESVRYLRVKGKMSEAMLVFQRMAYWNKSHLPPHVTLIPAPESTKHHKTSPLDLVRTKKMALTTAVISFSAFTGATTFYCLYLAAGDITGHMYTDFVVITVLDIPMVLIGTPLVNRYGRKKNSMVFTLIGSLSCIALGFTPKRGNLKILRLVFGMVGKTCIVVGGMARSLWAMELFPTHIRGEGVGVTQVLNKIGATSSAWVDKELSKVYDGAAFILIGVLTLASFCVQSLLPETQGVDIADIEEDSADDANSESMAECSGKSENGDSCELQVASYTNIAVHIDDVNVPNVKNVS